MSHLNRFGVEWLASVIAASLSMVLQAHAFQWVSFGVGMSVFAGAAFALAVLTVAVHRLLRSRVRQLVRRFAGLFVAAELLELSGVFSSARATAVAPSVSFVALIECLFPVFIVALSWISLRIARMSSSGQPYAGVLAQQWNHLPAKSFAIGLILTAVTTTVL